MYATKKTTPQVFKEAKMSYRIRSFWLIIAVLACFSTSATAIEEKILIFRGASDASAAVEIDTDIFIVADDENNTLRAYNINSPGDSVTKYDLTSFLSVDIKHPESDIEGAARIGGRIYWITSHGRNKDGKIRNSRYRFFATDIVRKNGRLEIEPVGTPCTTLAKQLVAAEFAVKLGLDKATRFGDIDLSKKKLKKLAPKEKGLNIEGLCASADGKRLYIGLRNPQFKDEKNGSNMAIVIPLENPAQIVEKYQAAVFGKPLLWNLENRGIRSMEYSAYHKAYFIVAGPHDGRKDFAIYRWSGNTDTQPKLLTKIARKKFNPEAITPVGDGSRLLLLSDDGTLPIKVDDPSQCTPGELLEDGRCPNKHLLNPAKKTFKGLLFKP